MKLFAGRPLCFGCFFAAAASFLCAYLGYKAAFIIAASSLVLSALSAILLRRRRGVDLRLYFSLLFALVFIVSLSSGAYFYTTAGRVTEDEVELSGYVYTDHRYYSECAAVITEQDGRAVNYKCFVKFPGLAPSDFTKFTARGKISETSGEYASYMYGDGIFLQTGFESAEYGDTEKCPEYYISQLRYAAASAFYRVSDWGDLYSCLFLGQRDEAPAELSRQMRSLGTSHLLAVSGLHVVALLAGFDFVLRGIFGKNRVNTAILAVFALFYMALAGFSGSVVRASIMYFIMNFGFVFKRRGDGITDLLFAVFIMLAACPYAVYDAGFLLSASATSGIILLGSPLTKYINERSGAEKRRLLKIPVYIADSFIITGSALLFTIPVTAAYYGTVVISSLLNNLLISPLVMILLYACPYLLLFSFIPGLGRLAGLFCDGICSAVSRLSGWLYGFSTVSVSVKYDFVKYVLIIFGAAVFIMMIAGVHKKRFYVSAAAVLIVALTAGAVIYNAGFAKKDVIIMQSNYNGELIAVCSGGKCTVFNLSTGSCYELSRELLRHGVTHVDYVCHPKYTAFITQQIPKDLVNLTADRIVLPDCLSSRLCERLCGKKAEFYDADGGYETTVGRLEAKTYLIEANDKTYVALDLGRLMYTNYSPLDVYREVMIYGTYAYIRETEVKRGDVEYIPEKYYEKYKEKENAEFYGKLTVIELKNE